MQFSMNNVWFENCDFLIGLNFSNFIKKKNSFDSVKAVLFLVVSSFLGFFCLTFHSLFDKVIIIKYFMSSFHLFFIFKVFIFWTNLLNEISVCLELPAPASLNYTSLIKFCKQKNEKTFFYREIFIFLPIFS